MSKNENLSIISKRHTLGRIFPIKLFPLSCIYNNQSEKKKTILTWWDLCNFPIKTPKKIHRGAKTGNSTAESKGEGQGDCKVERQLRYFITEGGLRDAFWGSVCCEFGPKAAGITAIKKETGFDLPQLPAQYQELSWTGTPKKRSAGSLLHTSSAVSGSELRPLRAYALPAPPPGSSLSPSAQAPPLLPHRRQAASLVSV